MMGNIGGATPQIIHFLSGAHTTTIEAIYASAITVPHASCLMSHCLIIGERHYMHLPAPNNPVF